MGGVFISYRREESVYALLLYHRLTREFGAEQVFRDIERISPGEDFVTRLDQEIPGDGRSDRQRPAAAARQTSHQTEKPSSSPPRLCKTLLLPQMDGLDRSGSQLMAKQ
jgi:hypothetical protein